MTLTVLPAGVKSKKGPGNCKLACPGIIKKSLRFRASASACLSRTSIAPTDGKKLTYSGWVKKSKQGSSQIIFGGTYGSGGNLGILYFDSTDALVYRQLSVNTNIEALYVTTQVFRDPSAWYHIVIAFDTTQATAADRIKIYVDGTIISSYSTQTTIALNSLTPMSVTGWSQYIGAILDGTLQSFLDGYSTEINIIDGQALDALSFGEICISTGGWVSKKYSGTYGANGSSLTFDDNSTLAAIAKDVSGNNNNWTTNNISLSGTTYDSMNDVPAPVDAARGNYATINPLSIGVATLSNGNLTYTNNNALTIDQKNVSMAIPPSGKFCFELRIEATGTLNNFTYFGKTNAAWDATGNININGATVSTGNTFTANDILSIAFDEDAKIAYFYKNNILKYTSGAINSSDNIIFVCGAGGTIFHINFGQTPFAYAPPAGFVSLNTYNLSNCTVTPSGTFTGNANADGPFVYTNGTPTALTINGNAVTWGTHADKLANGFKVRTAAATHNHAGSNTYVVTTAGNAFREQIAQTNP
jgi:hypothetical protein